MKTKKSIRLMSLFTVMAIMLSLITVPMTASAADTPQNDGCIVEVKVKDTDTGEYITAYTPGENITYEIAVSNTTNSDIFFA